MFRELGPLGFPTLASAIRYAERQGLTYVVQAPTGQIRNSHGLRADETSAQNGHSTRPFSNAPLDRLGLSDLQNRYGHALDSAANRDDPSGPASLAAPMSVVRDSTLTLEAKRSILMNWAWTEYLIDQATNEGVPENNRPSRLDKVEQSLLVLEHSAAIGRHGPGTRKVA